MMAFLLLLSLSAAAAAEVAPSSGLRTSEDSRLVISEHPDCVGDLENLSAKCRLSPTQLKNNFAALECLQDHQRSSVDTADGVGSISPACQHLLWNFKKNMTNEERFLERMKEACNDVLPSLKECQELFYGQGIGSEPGVGGGAFISCAISKKTEIHDNPTCVNFLTQIEMIIFSDYHLIGNFVEKCSANIAKTNCGRLGKANKETIDQSQYYVIACLGDHIDILDDSCKREILRIAEIQADDYHLDRSLYYACKEDRERFCEAVKSGDGRVYECLLRHKKEPALSPNCRKQLTRRQHLVAHDYKASQGLVKFCKEEIRRGKCRKGTSEDKPIRMAQILLCLEEMMTKEAEVNQQCVAEMREHRRSLMEDYQMSPEIVDKCSADIKGVCKSATLKPGGFTIHCLMKAAANRSLTNSACEEQLLNLMSEVNIAEDWTLDPILKETCQEVVISSGCGNSKNDESVMSCLMTQFTSNSRHMTAECKQTLLEIQYFLARKFSLDPKLYRKCHKDAQRLCGAKENWHTEAPKGGGASLIFPCLARYLYGIEKDEQEADYDNASELSDDCADQVERVLEQRAISVKLHPEIEDACHGFLVTNCQQFTKPGEELQCLQDHMEELDMECKGAVQSYTIMESQNVILNPLLATACHRVIDGACTHEVATKDEGAVMRCLINIKDQENSEGGDVLMDQKCAAAITHWQVMALKDWKFSFKFKEACKMDVRNLCTNHPRTKYEVINCLSSILTEDIIAESNHRISFPCRKELKFELLQKHSSVRLNHDISKSCDTEIGKYCQGHHHVLECLKQVDHRLMSRKCVQKLFAEEQEEILINAVDHALMVSCKHEIKQHCPEDTEPNGILNCLQEAKSDPNFDPKCKTLVIRRTMQQMRDYRLNPRLRKACQSDLPKFCKHILENADHNNQLNHLEKEFLEGKVIECLKAKFLDSEENKEKALSPTCHREVENVLRMAALNFNANPLITEKCPKSLEFCENETNYDKRTMEDGGRVEECLMGLFRDRKIMDFGDGLECKKTVARLIENANLDIHIDPLLNKACALDLTKFCPEVPRGNGQQIQCLVAVSQQSSKFKLEPKCDKMLRRRLEMFDMALQVVPIQGLQDVYYQLINSPQKHYFLVSLGSFIAMCFLIGLCVGRISKESSYEDKNK